ncbi:MAG: NUDIX domain-containing protein [Phycisphaerales bacterium]
MSVRFVPLNRPLRIEVEGQRPSLDESAHASWQTAQRENPRLFDGPILAVRSVDVAAGLIVARPDRFAHVVCQPGGRDLPTTILSVTGVIEAGDPDAIRVLLARRGAQTRSYPGMWEFAPAGGLESPESSGSLGLEGIMQTLRAELREEVGVASPLCDARAIGIVFDSRARSLDVVIRARIEGETPTLQPGAERAWECADARWVDAARLERTLEELDGGVIEPTLEIARHLERST